LYLGWLEVSGHRGRSGGQAEGEGRGLPQGQAGGGQGQGGRPQGSQDRQEDRCPPESDRVLRLPVELSFNSMLLAAADAPPSARCLYCKNTL